MPKKIENIKVHYPEQLSIIYANHAQFQMSLSDIMIDFGLMQQDPTVKPAKFEAHIKTRIIMSPQHAKVFVTKMKNVIDNYEKEVGKIVIEPKKK